MNQRVLDSIRFYDSDLNVIPYGQWGIHEYPDGQNQLWFSRDAVRRLRRAEVSVWCPELLDLALQVELIDQHSSINEKVIMYAYGSRCDKVWQGDTLAAPVANSIDDEIFPGWVVLLPHHDSCWGLEIEPPIDLSSYKGIIGADASALLRWGYEGVSATKERDATTGEVTRLALPTLEPGHYLVMDDICDGGATFLRLADELDAQGVTADLLVMHGVFSNNGDSKVADRYQNVYVSNSYPLGRPVDPRVKVFNVWGLDDLDGAIPPLTQ